MKKLFLLAAYVCIAAFVGAQDGTLPGYTQARKFTADKLKSMLFSTSVDPHWFQQGNKFWYSYKDSKGTSWYVVDPSARTKTLLFDQVELAAQLSEIVQDPFIASQLPIRNLEAMSDGYTFTFKVISSKDKDEKGKDGKKKKKEKKSFSFRMTAVPVN